MEKVIGYLCDVTVNIQNMPFYKTIDTTKPEGLRTAKGLIRLREELNKGIPARRSDENLLVCSWNIREFGGNKHGGRMPEDLFYIAEVISRFDLVAVQEVRDDLGALDRLMGILGGWWKYLVTDVTLGDQGNQERLAFLYDSRKVSFGGLVGEIQPEMVKKGKTLQADFAFARSPFMAGFKAGWYKFSICTDHFYYGESKPDDEQRVEESKRIAALLKKRARSNDSWANNIILLGDFNVFTLNDKTFKAIEEAEFRIPEGLRGKYTNAKKDKPFDQIAFWEEGTVDKIVVKSAGVFDYFAHVYREEDMAEYGFTDAKKYREYRTYKMSDHLPIWVELETDFGTRYLERKVKGIK